MKGAIFDMDGTLLDSMQVWVHVGEQYLRNRGIEPEEGLGDVLFPMSMRDGAVYVKEKYGLPDPPDTIVTDMDAIVFAAYRDEVLPKPGVAAYLESLKKRGIPMAVATATNRPMVEAAQGGRHAAFGDGLYGLGFPAFGGGEDAYYLGDLFGGGHQLQEHAAYRFRAEYLSGRN